MAPNLGLPFVSDEILGKFLNLSLSVPQFLPPCDVDNSYMYTDLCIVNYTDLSSRPHMVAYVLYAMHSTTVSLI